MFIIAFNFLTIYSNLRQAGVGFIYIKLVFAFSLPTKNALSIWKVSSKGSPERLSSCLADPHMVPCIHSRYYTLCPLQSSENRFP